MNYVLLSVCCNILVAVIIKVARGQNVNVQQLVLWNYPTTVLFTYFLLNPNLNNVAWGDLPYTYYIPLTILLPTLFIFIALAIKYSGIVKTDIAQRMSLFIPLLASFVLFNEDIQNLKLIGIAVGLLAVICSIGWGKKDSSYSNNIQRIFYPAIVFVGMGIIDILFKQIAQHEEVSYITSMFFVFVGAMAIAFFILIYKLFVKGEVFDIKALCWGLVLGIFNFGNIFFYMKAHRALPENPAIVFTTMNIGVIVLGALVGVLFFKEKLSKINIIGLILAVVSIFLISYL